MDEERFVFQAASPIPEGQRTVLFLFSPPTQQTLPPNQEEPVTAQMPGCSGTGALTFAPLKKEEAENPVPE